MKSISNWINLDDRLAVEQQLEQLALESGFLSNLSQGLKKIIPSLLDKLHDAVGMLAGATSEVAPPTTSTIANLTSIQKQALQKMKALDFLVFAETPVQVPENFYGDLHSYLQTLNGMASKVYSGVIALLGEYNVILSSFINNREVQTGLKTHEALFRGVQGAREQREKVIHHFFPKATGKSRLPLRMIMKRGAELEPTFREANKLRGEHGKQNLAQVNAMVQQSVDLLKIVLSQLQNSPNNNVSPEATMDVSKGAYQIAKEVEHLAAFHFQLVTALKSVDDLCTTIMDK